MDVSLDLTSEHWYLQITPIYECIHVYTWREIEYTAGFLVLSNDSGGQSHLITEVHLDGIFQLIHCDYPVDPCVIKAQLASTGSRAFSVIILPAKI